MYADRSLNGSWRFYFIENRLYEKDLKLQSLSSVAISQLSDDEIERNKGDQPRIDRRDGSWTISKNANSSFKGQLNQILLLGGPGFPNGESG